MKTQRRRKYDNEDAKGLASYAHERIDGILEALEAVKRTQWVAAGVIMAVTTLYQFPSLVRFFNHDYAAAAETSSRSK